MSILDYALCLWLDLKARSVLITKHVSLRRCFNTTSHSWIQASMMSSRVSCSRRQPKSDTKAWFSQPTTSNLKKTSARNTQRYDRYVLMSCISLTLFDLKNIIWLGQANKGNLNIVPISFNNIHCWYKLKTSTKILGTTFLIPPTNNLSHIFEITNFKISWEIKHLMLAFNMFNIFSALFKAFNVVVV